MIFVWNISARTGTTYSERSQKDKKGNRMYSPKEVAQNYIAIGAGKTKLPILRMFILGILAGMFIAFAGVGASIASVSVQSASVAKLVGACVFPAGLVMVLVAGSELFTGNCLLIIPVLEKKATVAGMLKNLIVVYIGNLVGSVLIAALVVYGHTFSLFSNAVAASAIHTAVSKLSLTWGDAFIRGILANFLGCIAVWIALAAKDVAGKVVGLYLPIMLFVLSGFEHSVANMYFLAAGILAKSNAAYLTAATTAHASDNFGLLNWGAYFSKNIIPVTLGNIVGGMLLVGVAYWYIYLRGSETKPPLNDNKVLTKAGKR
jgi:formate/nitrite transporter